MCWNGTNGSPNEAKAKANGKGEAKGVVVLWQKGRQAEPKRALVDLLPRVGARELSKDSSASMFCEEKAHCALCVCMCVCVCVCVCVCSVCSLVEQREAR